MWGKNLHNIRLLKQSKNFTSIHPSIYLSTRMYTSEGWFPLSCAAAKPNGSSFPEQSCWQSCVNTWSSDCTAVCLFAQVFASPRVLGCLSVCRSACFGSEGEGKVGSSTSHKRTRWNVHLEVLAVALAGPSARAPLITSSASPRRHQGPYRSLPSVRVATEQSVLFHFLCNNFIMISALMQASCLRACTRPGHSFQWAFMRGGDEYVYSLAVPGLLLDVHSLLHFNDSTDDKNEYSYIQRGRSDPKCADFKQSSATSFRVWMTRDVKKKIYIYIRMTKAQKRVSSIAGQLQKKRLLLLTSLPTLSLFSKYHTAGRHCYP